MAHYNISSEGSYTLADLEAKLRSITDWEWSEHDEETAEFKAGQDLYEEALQMYESIRISYLKTFDLSKIVVYKVGIVGEGERPFGKRFSDYRTNSEPATLYMKDKTKRNVKMIAFETNRASSLEKKLISCFKEHMDGVAPPFCIKEGGTGRVSI